MTAISSMIGYSTPPKCDIEFGSWARGKESSGITKRWQEIFAGVWLYHLEFGIRFPKGTTVALRRDNSAPVKKPK